MRATVMRNLPSRNALSLYGNLSDKRNGDFDDLSKFEYLSELSILKIQNLQLEYLNFDVNTMKSLSIIVKENDNK
jgi:hypothetical protein